ncbi:putative ATP-grasp-modified RiPP [Streptomyces fungicidicus]|uniref:putative ATP-grasp-modified RiPP n=1 Tax=Streptomyces fungicidicus TaxID=68203 RepID=UPI0034056530
MTTLAPEAPWALRLVTDRLPVEMGKHGTSRTAGTASVSGGGDGNGPQSQTRDDSTTDYESD